MNKKKTNKDGDCMHNNVSTHDQCFNCGSEIGYCEDCGNEVGNVMGNWENI